MCGLAIEHDNGEIISIRGDKADPFSQGYFCTKAVALQDFHSDPDRLRTPIRKSSGGWEPLSWDDAIVMVAERIRAIQGEHGADSVGMYLGNPNAHNFGNATVLPQFFKAIGSKNRFSASSIDQLPHHVASNYMFGAGMLLPIPDIDRTHFMLIIGGNPVVSNGSMMTAAGVSRRLRRIRERGGKVVVVDPRRTETARVADEHFFVRPESDALLLLSMINTIIEQGLADLGHLEHIIDGFDALTEAASEFAPESVASAVGITADDIRRLAVEFATAESAVCYSRMGASTQSFGGLCQWLTNVINIVTGNFDTPGGAMFPLPAFDMLLNRKRGRPSSYGRYASRVSDLPFFHNEFPVATLADEITTPGEGQIRSLITIAGNPVLSSPGGHRLADALESLDFMVSVDIYLNETTKHADVILPATMGLETSHYDIVFHALAVRNTAKYSQPLFEKSDEQRHDWQILKALTAALTGEPDDGSRPDQMLDMMLQAGPYGSEGMSLQRLIDNPHGVDLGPLQPCLEQRILTEGGRVLLAPQLYLDDLPRLAGFQESSEVAYPYRLIGRRVMRSHNTWTKNSQRLVSGENPCTLLLNPADADALGVGDGQMVKVASAAGELTIEVEVDDAIMAGVVSMPQGWGHNRAGTQLSVAATQPGVSMNDVTDAGRVDSLTGTAAFNGTPVAISAVATD
jgi:anaerobic selenocysteine-containing dehydrogenase